jgi:hypothetical protein
MDSTDYDADLERIAALIDGRLSGEEKAKAMKLLGESDEALEVFAHSLKERQADSEKIRPIQSARRWRRWTVVVPAAAAAIVAIAVLPTMRKHAGVPLGDQYASMLMPAAGQLPSGWERRPWVTRGTGGASAVSQTPESKLVFRLGVRSVDLQVALRRGDQSMAGTIAEEMQATLAGVGLANPVAASYGELKASVSSDALAQSTARATAAERDLRDLVDTRAFGFGQWVGAADLAAQAHNAGFFESYGTRVARSVSEGALDAEDTKALRDIDDRVAQGASEQALDEVHEILKTVIRRRSG